MILGPAIVAASQEGAYSSHLRRAQDIPSPHEQDRPRPLRPFSPFVARQMERIWGAERARNLILRATAEQALARAFWRTQTFFPRGA